MAPKDDYWWSCIYPSLNNKDYNTLYRRTRESLVDLMNDLFHIVYYGSLKIFERMLAMSIEYMSTNCTIFHLRTRYAMSSGKCHKELIYCLTVLGEHYHDQVVQWPTENERHAISNRLNIQRELPYCVGIIDGTLIESFGYQPHKLELNTRKCFYGFNLVIICDDQGLIRYAMHDEPGSQGDSCILRRSQWYSDIKLNLQNSKLDKRPFYILSDKGILGIDGIVTPFLETRPLTATAF